MRYLAPIVLGPLTCAFAQPAPQAEAPRHAFADGSEARMRYLVELIDRDPEGLGRMAIRDALQELLWLHGERGLEALVERYPGVARPRHFCLEPGPHQWLGAFAQQLDPAWVATRYAPQLGQRNRELNAFIFRCIVRSRIDDLFEPAARFVGSAGRGSGVSVRELSEVTGLDSDDVEEQRARWSELRPLDESARARQRLANAAESLDLSNWRGVGSWSGVYGRCSPRMSFAEALRCLVDAAEKAGDSEGADSLWNQLASYTGIHERDAAAWRRRLANEAELFGQIIHHELSRRGKGLHPKVQRYLADHPVERVRAIVEQIDQGKLEARDVKLYELPTWQRTVLNVALDLDPGELRTRLLASESRADVVRVLVDAIVAGEIEGAHPALFEDLVSEGMSDLVRPLIEQPNGERWLETLASAGDVSALRRASGVGKHRIACRLAQTPEGRRALLELEPPDGAPTRWGYERGMHLDLLVLLPKQRDPAVYDVALRRMAWSLRQSEFATSDFYFARSIFAEAGGELHAPDQLGPPGDWTKGPPPPRRVLTEEECRGLFDHASKWRSENPGAEVLPRQLEVLWGAVRTGRLYDAEDVVRCLALRFSVGDPSQAYSPTPMMLVEVIWGVARHFEQTSGETITLPPGCPPPPEHWPDGGGMLRPGFCFP